MISLRASLPAKLSAMLDRPVIHRASAWLGLLGFMTGKSPHFLGDFVRDSNHVSGLTSFLVIRMWFGKAVEDFNNAIVQGGANEPQLIAQLSNGFTSAFFFPPGSVLPSFSHPCSGMGGLCVLRCPSHLCLGPITRYGWWQVIQKRFVLLSNLGQFYESSTSSSAERTVFYIFSKHHTTTLN